jgi:hypothetical protein
MDFPTSEVGYTSATNRRGDHEVHKGHVVALAKNKSRKRSYCTILIIDKQYQLLN